MMHKLISFLLVLFFASTAFGADVNLRWDYGDDSGISGFALYAVVVGNDYNYEAPIGTVGPTIRTVTVDIQSNAELKFTCRAFLDGQSTRYYSGDSNEVYHAIVIAPSNLIRE